jgi:uncharacterized protein (TIGR00290 family)
LHTVINEETRRVGLHGVHESLIQAQADAMGLKLVKLYLPSSEDHTAYEKLMLSFYSQCAAEQIDAVVFGDIFLEDLKNYREKMLQVSGVKGIFPLWRMKSKQVTEGFLDAGFKTVLCSANAKYFQPQDLGVTLTREFVNTFSEDVDPAGENGEFHSFVYDGPVFKKPVAFIPGDTVKKSYSYKIRSEDGKVEEKQSDFWFKDLLPV